MSVKSIISYIGLGIVVALIICVLVLAFIPTKIMPNFASAPDEIKVYKSETEQSFSCNSSTFKTEYDNIYKKVDSLGKYSILDTLFMGVLGQHYQISYNGTSSNKSISTLQQEFDYLVELKWSENQSILKTDGKEYTNADDTNVTSYNRYFRRAIIGVSNQNNAGELVVYLYPSTSSSTAYFSYIAYANPNALYTYLNELEDNLFA